MVKTYTKIGDVFSAKTDEKTKKYFQLIAYDLTQLNSDVIRVFKERYPINSNPDLSKIVSGEIDFYIHCTTKAGIKMNLWNKIGNNKNIGETNHILFRSTNDYGVKPGEKPITVSTEWWVWRINEKQKYVGKLEKEYQKSYIGLIVSPFVLLELKKDYTIVMVTHNMQQAVRVSDNTAFFLLGEVIEYNDTEKLFSIPSDKRTEDYITGRFG